MKSKVAYHIVRVILGLAWVFFGIGKFLPMNNAALAQPAMDFFAAMIATGYFMPFLGVAEILVGLLLLANRWVPLSMMIVSPIMLNIILFNLFLAPSLFGAIIMIVFVTLQVYIMCHTWGAYKPLLQSHYHN